MKILLFRAVVFMAVLGSSLSTNVGAVFGIIGGVGGAYAVWRGVRLADDVDATLQRQAELIETNRKGLAEVREKTAEVEAKVRGT